MAAVTVLASVLTGRRSGAALVQSCVRVTCQWRVDVTRDDGRTWRRGPLLGRPYDGRLGAPTQTPDSLAALDSQHLYAYGRAYDDSASWWSPDGGSTWRSLGLTGSGFDLNATRRDVLEVPRPERLGNQNIGRFVVVTPSGRMTPRSQFPVGKAGWISPIARTDTATMLAAADNRGHGWLMKSFDEGLTWSRLPEPACGQGDLDGPQAVGGSTLLAHCYARDTVLQSDDGGVRWVSVGSIPANYGLVAATRTTWWGLGNGAQSPLTTRIVVSTDHGRRWRPVVIGPLARDVTVAAFAVRGSRAWFSVYDSVSVAGHAVLHLSDDAGLHWRTVRLPT